MKPTGYIRNSSVYMRPGDTVEWLFYVDADGNTYCQLDGYDIRPLEQAPTLRELVADCKKWLRSLL